MSITEPHDRLAQWLCAELGADHVQVSPEIGRPPSGYSSDTIIIDAIVQRDGSRTPERFVVRREIPEPSIYPRQAPDIDLTVEVQYRVMAAIAKVAPDIPLASLVGYEPDPDVFGAPFFVMRHVVGQVPVEIPIYVAEGFFADAAPEQRRTMIDHGIDMLIRLQAVDWEDAGLGWLIAAGEEPTTARQLRQWLDHAQTVLKGRSHPVLERAAAWLQDNPPVEDQPVLCWGDARPGNIIWRDFQPVCVTDFEAASIEPGGSDIGWWLVFDRYSHNVAGCKRLDGEPTRDEQLARYQAGSAHPVADPAWHELFAATRFTTMTVQGIDRLAAQGQYPADTTEWRDNPMTDILEELLAEN